MIELVAQAHVFEPSSWQDKEKWEMLFFNAYLKHDKQALERLEHGLSMHGGNENLQRLEFQRVQGRVR